MDITSLDEYKTQTNTPTAEPFTPVQEHTWTLVPDSRYLPSADSGSRLYEARVRVEIALGRVTAASKFVPPADFQGLSDACEVDPAHDALLPMQTTLRSEGPIDLDTTLRLHVHDIRGGTDGDPIPIEAATRFEGGGSECQAMGDSGEGAGVRLRSLAPDHRSEHRYVLVLHDFFSDNYDSKGNVYGLRHLLGYITDLRVQVAGSTAGDPEHLNETACYTGTARQGVVGAGIPDALYSVAPVFALVDGDFDFEYERAQGLLEKPSGYDPC